MRDSAVADGAVRDSAVRDGLSDSAMADASAPVASAAPFTVVGDPSAAVCIGDSCEIPDHHEQAVVNRRLDDDSV